MQPCRQLCALIALPVKTTRYRYFLRTIVRLGRARPNCWTTPLLSNPVFDAKRQGNPKVVLPLVSLTLNRAWQGAVSGMTTTDSAKKGVAAFEDLFTRPYNAPHLIANQM